MTTLERATKIENMLPDNIRVGVGISDYAEGTQFIFMQHKNGRDAYGLHDKTDEEILKEAKELSEPRYTKITTVCLNIIGKEIWVDKKIPIVIVSIARDSEGNNSVTSAEGKTYLADNLYIKG